MDIAVRPGTWTEKDLQVSGNIIEHESRFVDAGKKAGTAQKKATEAAWESMDRLAESGAKNIERAKEGLGKAGRFAVDVGVAGLGMAGDAAAAALTGGSSLVPMAVRGFGGSAQEARQGGATLGQQMAYGLGSAGISVATEKLSNATKPFVKMFGKGVADDLLEDAIGKAVSRAAKTAAGKTALDGILRTGAGFAGEGLEEFLEDVASPILKRATWDPKAQFDLQEAVYDFLVGGALGGLGGAVDVVGGAKGRHQDYTQQAKTQNIDRAYAAMGRYGMFDPRARAAMGKAVENGRPEKLRMPTLNQGPLGNHLGIKNTTAGLNQNGLGAFSEQEVINLSSGKKNKIVSSFSEAVAFIQNALQNRSSAERAYMGKLPAKTVEMVKAATGMDLNGYNAIMTSDKIRHMVKNHGDPVSEGKRGQIALTPDLIARIPDILSEPDRVVPSEKTDSRGLPILIFEKNIGDHYVAVQAVSGGTHSIQADTLYINKKEPRKTRVPIELLSQALPTITPKARRRKGSLTKT